MAGPNDVLTKTFQAGAAIAKYTIVKFDSSDDQVINATSATDLPIGVALEAADASGDRIEVAILGIAKVKAAGAITRGDFITATAGGEAVALAAVVTLKKAAGRAMAGVADNDIFPMLICHFEAVTA